MKNTLFILSLILIFSGCTDKNSFTVEGLIKGKPDKTVYLKKLDVSSETLIDSSKVSKAGEFKFKVKASDEGFYQLSSSPSNFMTLLAGPGEKIRLVFESNNLYEKYTVSGSEGTENLRVLDENLVHTKTRLDSLTRLYQSSSKDPGFSEKKSELEIEYNNIVVAQRKKNIEFIIKNTNSLAAIKALYQRINDDTYVLYSPNDVQYMKIVTDSLTRHYPNSGHVQALARDLEKEMNQLYVNQLSEVADKIPATKLDPALTDVNGKRVALSSLRGKYVLLTFWSVRSRECVAENIQLKEYYKKYNKSGFEIYQINIDTSESDWKNAVKFDELPWISTREDDPANPKNAILFNVKGVPANYLFDKEGNIIGSDLHGRSLMLKLEQIFKR